MRSRLTDQSGQALLLTFGLVAALLTGALVLVALGEALGAKSREQRAADLAAVSAAAAMRRVYPRLFEPAYFPPPRPGLPPVPNPRHLPRGRYVAIARDAAVNGAARNGARPARLRRRHHGPPASFFVGITSTLGDSLP